MNVLTDPAISVIMPVYNSEKYIDEAVNSILDQTYSNFELIIVNDNSTDSSWEKILKFQDRRIVRLKNEKNYGFIRSYYKGLAVARGQYVAHMDSDDISFLDRFQVQFEYLESHQEVSVVGTQIQYIDENGSISNKIWRPAANPMVVKWTLFFEDSIADPTSMIRRNAIDEIKHNFPTTNYACDYEIWLNLSKKYMIANLDEVKLYYRVHGKNYSYSHQEKLHEEEITLKKSALEDFMKIHVDEEIVKFIAHPESGNPEVADKALRLLIDFRKSFLRKTSLTVEEDKRIREDFINRYYPLLSLYPNKGRFLRYYLFLIRIDPEYRSKLAQKVTKHFGK